MKKIYETLKIHSHLLFCVYLTECALCLNFELAQTPLQFLLNLLSEILFSCAELHMRAVLLKLIDPLNIRKKSVLINLGKNVKMMVLYV